MDKKAIINKEKKEAVLKFYKDAFCVDGEVKLAEGDFNIISAIELNDSKRGKFYVGLLDAVSEDRE